MKQEVLSHFPMPWLSGIGLLLFLSVFIGAAIWIYRSGSAELYRKMAELPLKKQGDREHE